MVLCSELKSFRCVLLNLVIVLKTSYANTFFSQSYIGGVVAYKVLPRPMFSQLQEKIFPIYFGMQTVLPVVLALTYPGPRNPLSVPSGIQGAFAEVNRWSVLVPLGTMFLTGLANMFFIGYVFLRSLLGLFFRTSRSESKWCLEICSSSIPSLFGANVNLGFLSRPQTTKIMKLRKHQGTNNRLENFRSRLIDFRRNPGRKEELRCRPTFYGYAEVKQSFWQDAWHLLFSKPRGAHCNDVVWRFTR